MPLPSPLSLCTHLQSYPKTNKSFQRELFLIREKGGSIDSMLGKAQTQSAKSWFWFVLQHFGFSVWPKFRLSVWLFSISRLRIQWFWASVDAMPHMASHTWPKATSGSHQLLLVVFFIQQLLVSKGRLKVSKQLMWERITDWQTCILEQQWRQKCSKSTTHFLNMYIFNSSCQSIFLPDGNKCHYKLTHSTEDLTGWSNAGRIF